jgi:hypothetical protein
MNPIVSHDFFHATTADVTPTAAEGFAVSRRRLAPCYLPPVPAAPQSQRRMELPLDDAALRQATRDLATRLYAPARVTAVETAPRRLSLLLDWPEPGARRRLVIDVDPAHPTLHLAPAGREPAVASTGGFGGGLPGLFLTAVEEAGEPRLLCFRFAPPPRAAGTGSRTLVAEWTGDRKSTRLNSSHSTSSRMPSSA